MASARSSKLASSSYDLFGEDDPEFLEALRRVDMPIEVPAPPPVRKESSPSSDLFGTEDSAFLDALSKTFLPGDLDPLCSSPTVPSSPTPDDQGLVETRKRKCSTSPDDSFSHVIGAYGITSKEEPLYTDSDVYGPSKFHGFGEYMQRKRAKLSIQNNEMENVSSGKKSALFQGLALYINGKTNPSVQELRKLIVLNGGIFHPYLDRKKLVTHVIASNLTPSKVLEFKNMKVATPEWLLESISAGNLLPWKDFAISARNRPEDSQGRLAKSTQSFTSQNIGEKITDVSMDDPESRTDISGHGQIPPPTNASTPKSINMRPLYSTDPVTRTETTRIPSYAAHGSNPHAKRKMEDPQWRTENTAVAPGFIEGYYRHSRLHHLSTWKSELQELVANAVERVENGEDYEGLVTDSLGANSSTTSMSGIQFQRPTSPRKGKAAVANRQTIMHCDFDSFFVSAGLVDRPTLKGKPVVVCHSQGEQGGGASTSEIASSSYEARKFGIKNGMSLGQAKKLCPDLRTIPYEFERYKRFSLQFYMILMSYADDLQAVSVDEALVDVSSTVEKARRLAPVQNDSQGTPDFAKELAETIRARVKNTTGCEVSIGISHNILLARVATRHAKPAGSYHIRPEEVSDILAPLDIEDLRGFGWSTRGKVEAKFGVTTLGELAKQSKGALCDSLGRKTGETLWKAVRGIDDTKIESDRMRKSVSCEINYGIRFENEEEAESFVRGVAREVSVRLGKLGMCGRSLTLKVMTRDPKAPVEPPKFLGHGICETTNKTSPLSGPGGRAGADETIIGECAWKLLKGMHLDPKELRGIGIHVQKLEKAPDAASDRAPPGQSVLQFKKSDNAPKETPSTPQKGKPLAPAVIVDPPSQDIMEDLTISPCDDQRLRPDSAEVPLPSLSQIDPSFLDALPADIRAEIQLEYARAGSGQTIAGPSRQVGVFPPITNKLPPAPKETKPSADIVRITRQLAPKSRPSVSPTKRVHPLFAKRAAPNNIKVAAAELRLLNVDADVWAELPIELQREQLAALRAANVGTGIAIRASMSTQAKQERILSRWRSRGRSPSVSVRGQRFEILAKTMELPGLKQRGKSKSDELRVSETEDIQAVISQWVEGFEEDGPRQGDIDYFGRFLARCVETDVGAERAVSALKWWRVLLLQRWADSKEADRPAEVVVNGEAGRTWWKAFWEVKKRMDGVVRKRYGGGLSLK